MSPSAFLVFLLLAFDLIGSFLLFQAEARLALRTGRPKCLFRKKCLGHGCLCVASILALALALSVAGMHKPIENQAPPEGGAAAPFLVGGH
jgi:hypothetical protein